MQKKIYDPLYGFIFLTDLEWKIIHTPYYQRLRWIKQLGFSCYHFYGAEHSRFGHSLGVMFNAHSIIKTMGVGVSDEELNSDSNTPEKKWHVEIRLAALLHDIGTFCFSHTTEMSYIRAGKRQQKKNRPSDEGQSERSDNHEHLGSWIMKNSKMPSGITYYFQEYGVDPQRISDLVKGISDDPLANQILHSEIDCDRMDYLLRDAHHTGLNYGAYDRDYLLHHFALAEVNGKKILTIKENAIHCVEDFLSSRFAWYSQVVRSPKGALYDILAAKLTDILLEKKLIVSYQDLLDMAKFKPEEFFGFNDQYFFQLLYKSYHDGVFALDASTQSMASHLIFQKPCKIITEDVFSKRLLKRGDEGQKQKILQKARKRVKEIQDFLDKKGRKQDWLVADIPERTISFLNSKRNIVKEKSGPNLLIERDPVKIMTHSGEVKLLVDLEDSLIGEYQSLELFIPTVFTSIETYEFLVNEGQLVFTA